MFCFRSQSIRYPIAHYTIDLAAIHAVNTTMHVYPIYTPHAHRASFIIIIATMQKSVNFSYDISSMIIQLLEDIKPANTRPVNGVEITVAAPDIYVNPGDLSEQAEEEPKAKEAAVADEKAERDEGASNSDRSMQSLILKFGDDDDNASQHSTEKEELTSL